MPSANRTGGRKSVEPEKGATTSMPRGRTVPPAQPRAARYRRRTTDLPGWSEASDTGAGGGPGLGAGNGITSSYVIGARETRCPTEQHVIKNDLLRHLFLAALVILPVAGIIFGGGLKQKKSAARPDRQQQQMPSRLSEMQRVFNPHKSKSDAQLPRRTFKSDAALDRTPGVEVRKRKVRRIPVADELDGRR